MPAGADPSDGRRLGLSDDGLRRFKRSGTSRPSLEQLDLRQGSYQRRVRSLLALPHPTIQLGR